MTEPDQRPGEDVDAIGPVEGAGEDSTPIILDVDPHWRGADERDDPDDARHGFDEHGGFDGPDEHDEHDDDAADDDDDDPLGRSARAVFEWAIVVTVAIVVAVVVRTFLLAHFVVDGTSMASTLDSGDRVFVNKLSYRIGEPSRGDVIVLHQISGSFERDLIKRVIALPGETIEIRSCEVLITDPEGTTRRLVEPYLDPAVVTPGNCGGDYRPADGEVVPDDHVFVLGDNRGGSQDSRALGPVPYDDIVGRAFVVFWPRQNWQWL